MQREQLARGGGGSSRDDDEGMVVMLRRSSAAARVTCGLCRGLVRDATTVPECLHSFCRSCIYEKFADEEDSCCPTCNIDLGCSPLDKIRVQTSVVFCYGPHHHVRADHNLQSVREKLFPSKRQKNEGVPSLHPASVFVLPLGVHGGNHPAKNAPAYLSGEPMNIDQQGKNKDFQTSRLLLVSNVAGEAEIVQLQEDTEPLQSSLENGRHQAEDPESRAFVNKRLEDAWWKKVSDCRSKTDPDIIYSNYVDKAIQHMVENIAVVRKLTQRITYLEKENLRLKKLENFEKEVKAKEAVIATLEERCRAKDQLIENWSTRFNKASLEHKEAIEAIAKKTHERAQKLEQTEKALEFEQNKEKELERNLQEKILTFNKILSDMGSELFLSSSREPTEKANCLGRQLETLQVLLATYRKNHVKTMKNAVADGVSFALAKLKASNPSLNLQALEADFDCSEEDATKIIEGMKPFGNTVAEEMEVGSPSHSDQSSGSKK